MTMEEDHINMLSPQDQVPSLLTVNHIIPRQTECVTIIFF